MNIAQRLVMGKTGIKSPILAGAALRMMEERKITSLVVVDAELRPLGVVHLHDLWTLELF